MAKVPSVTQALLTGESITRKQQMQMVISLSIPAVLAQISSTIMQYIDAAMVGSLGANATAAIGLVSSSTWLFGGLCNASVVGFSVQVAQYAGAGQREKGRAVFCQSIMMAAVMGLLLATIGTTISGSLPVWLGGKEEIQRDSSRYFFILCSILPALEFRQLAGGMLQCSGNIKTPSMLNILMCGLDVLFNSLLIFPTRQVTLLGLTLTVPGAGLGVTGAALGTALAEVITCLLMLRAACLGSDFLRLDRTCSWKFDPVCYKTAAKVAIPLAFEHSILSSAQIVTTHIVAPLGTIAVASHSLAITAESLCYMPGSGIGTAATTLVGQSLGADRKDLARRFARLSVLLGVGVMSATGLLMFLLAPWIFTLLTPDPGVQVLGASVLRIEALAEPLFAAAMVTAGALRGAGDTKIPSLMNLMSMWGIRITTATLLAPRLGLYGVWIAMCVELNIRGILFLIRLFREKWLDQQLIAKAG